VVGLFIFSQKDFTERFTRNSNGKRHVVHMGFHTNLKYCFMFNVIEYQETVMEALLTTACISVIFYWTVK